MTIEQLRQLEQSATPGEWLDHSGIVYRHACDGDWHYAHVRPCRVADCWHKDDKNSGRCQGTHDARLIAAVRNALPALLDIAEAAREVTSPSYLDAPGPYAEGVRLDAMRDLMAALSRLDDR